MKTFRVIATVAALAVAGASTAMPAGPKGTTKAPKVNTHAQTGGAKAPKVSGEPKSKSTGASHASAKKTKTTTTTSSTSTATAATPTTAEPNAISTKISSKPDQLAHIQTLLPQGMTLEQASAGFRNQGQFIAALNAAKNNNISFADLQKAMTVDGLSLGQAVKKVKAAPPTTTTTPTTPGSGGTL